MASIANIQSNIQGFSFDGIKSFLKQLNIVGLSVGYLVGSSMESIAQTFGDGVLKPIIAAALGVTKGGLAFPKFQVTDLLTKILSFVLTIATVYFLATALAIEVRKPIQNVYVVDTPDYGS